MEILRTPEERFANLSGFALAPHYVENLSGYEGIRIHYLDEGPEEAKQVFLCLHGEPTWSYLYRKMIPVFTAAGHRAVAPDFIGFGRSDKPVDEAVYTFVFHRWMLRRFVERLDLRNITLVCQDWGGLLGMTLPMDMPGRFARLLVMNTALATGDIPLGAGFLAWRTFAATNPDMDVAKLMARACETCRRRNAQLTPRRFQISGTKPECDAFLRWCRTTPMRKERKCRGGRGAGGIRSGMDRRLWPWA